MDGQIEHARKVVLVTVNYCTISIDSSVTSERGLSIGVRKAKRTPKRQGRKKRRTARINCLSSPFPSFPPPNPHVESTTSRVDPLDLPPLPKRNAVRGRTTADTVVPPSGTQNGIAALENGL